MPALRDGRSSDPGSTSVEDHRALTGELIVEMVSAYVGRRADDWQLRLAGRKEIASYAKRPGSDRDRRKIVDAGRRYDIAAGSAGAGGADGASGVGSVKGLGKSWLLPERSALTDGKVE